MKIGIIGCGWLGFPLAKRLVQKNHLVHGSTTSDQKILLLEEAGIIPFQIILEDQIKGDIASFLKVDILIINVPPGRSEANKSAYLNKMKSLFQKIKMSPIKSVVFMSSTSVYPNDASFKSEKSPVIEDNHLVKAERLFQESNSWETTILRLSGLINETRHPGRWLAGKRDLKNASAPVNLIHLDDCIGIIEKILERNIWGEVFNCTMSVHPTRKEFYTIAADQLKLEVPHFVDEQSRNGKTVSNAKLKEQLSYHFIHDDPMLWLNLS